MTQNVNEQLLLPLSYPSPRLKGTYLDRLQALLSGELDFHHTNSKYATHLIHAFPAKFPPQLPRLFINELTAPGDVVLDPMMGSGTTLVEATLVGRQGLGVDIDPLALRIAKVKVTPIHSERVLDGLHFILKTTRQRILNTNDATFLSDFEATFDAATQKFIRYWFAPRTMKSLFYLMRTIEEIKDPHLRLFFEVAFSAIIITKRGGVSLALDLAHTRPHRAKIVVDETGKTIMKAENVPARRAHILTKQIRPVLAEFERRVRYNLSGLLSLGVRPIRSDILGGNARTLPFLDESIDLIITSPPYAANAIDYMRAHKFSLVWFGYPIKVLGTYRSQYIGGESKLSRYEHQLPSEVEKILAELEEKDPAKMRVIHRYYTEMKDVLQEMKRVLKPGKAAILIVGTSIIRGVDIQIADCLAAIGRSIGFTIPAVGVRNLDRNRRMLPTSKLPDRDSQIQQRMHQEFVLAFYKPSS